MKHKLSFFLFLAVLFQFVRCTQDDPFNPANEQLPQATTTGANTFGFSLNGETWLPFAEDKKLNPINVVMGNDSIFMFSLNLISNKINRNESLKILLKCNQPGSVVPIGFTYIDNNKLLGCQVYDLKNMNLIFDITKIDFIKQIISGNFQVNGASNSCGNEKINITKGIFDCKFSK